MRQQAQNIITAYTQAEVLPALRIVERETRGGKGAWGFVAYEAAPAFDSALVVREPSPDLPLVWFRIGEHPPEEVVVAPEGYSLPVFSSDTTGQEWESAIADVHEIIARGESYQVNLTRRLRAAWPDEADTIAVYQRLRTMQKTPYAAFLDAGRFHILSLSPELFFSTEGDRITTRPMKGTSRRGRWLEEDTAFAAALRASEKERAENVMIVDLLRNDLGRLAVPGTVQVTDLFTVERYPTALQMTSTVTAQLRSDVGLTDIFIALFPCGSVTGAPKVQTMRHIAGAEKSPRGVYCGAVGVIKPGGDAVFNVAIRTLVIDKARGVAEYGVGGGIVWDSEAKKEWAETETKAALLTASPPPAFDLLETLRLETGVYFLRERHLDRVSSSAAYFGRPCDREIVETALDNFADSHNAGIWRIRLRVTPEGAPLLEATTTAFPLRSLADDAAPLPVIRSATPVSRNEVFLCHKTTNRVLYENYRRALPKGVFDVLLWNEEGEATEFTIGNLVAEIGGALYTPPRDCGLLNGVLRDELIAQRIIRERILTLADVRAASRLWLINGVRGGVPVILRPEADDSAGPQ